MESIALKVGRIITFGSYFKNSGGKKEPLEWRILETDGCICDNGYYVYYHRAAVRPACRINLATYLQLNDQKNL